MLRELARSYLTIVKDRVMNRLKALYRSWAIPCAGRDVYYTRHRAEWLAKIKEAGVRRRAERLYLQLDMLTKLRQQARRELLLTRLALKICEPRHHLSRAAPFSMPARDRRESTTNVGQSYIRNLYPIPAPNTIEA